MPIPFNFLLGVFNSRIYLCLGLKRLLSILLAVVLISQTFVNVGIGVYYHINKEYISQKLCENRNKPEVHCKGQCFLSKQLKKAEEREQKSSNLLKEKEEIISTEPVFKIYKLSLSNRNSNIFPPYAASAYISSYTYSIIKPPETAA